METKITIKQLAKEMVQNDLNLLSKMIKKSDKIFVAGHNGLLDQQL